MNNGLILPRMQSCSGLASFVSFWLVVSAFFFAVRAGFQHALFYGRTRNLLSFLESGRCFCDMVRREV